MRKSVILDERDIEIIADARKKTRPLFKRMSVLGFAAMVVGGIVEVNGNFWGFLVLAAGAIFLGIGVYFCKRYFKKSKKDFLAFVDQYNEIPSWPEDKKKI
ncbi:MAG: hypothetical protein A2Y58_03180 [Chloroflexi bacterium RBG_13_51_52]|nr:MAG: hypothetical protein A2Y58_03180 [Chloroflexi bacterium RBG_13_51_52]